MRRVGDGRLIEMNGEMRCRRCLAPIERKHLPECGYVRTEATAEKVGYILGTAVAMTLVVLAITGALVGFALGLRWLVRWLG